MGFDQISDLDALLRQIDALQRRVDELKALRPDACERLMRSWAIESTYNSNNIEGSTLSLGDTALLYDGARVDGPEDDIRQAEGGFAALRFLRSEVARRSPLTEALVKRAHELVFAEAKDPLARGAYRDVEVEITGTPFQPTPACYVSERMAQLVASCAKSRRHPAVVSALFHLEFESIHPFVNANGRTGRLMSNFLLMSAGYEPVNIQAESRARYIGAIREFQLNDDPFPFVEFFCSNLLDRLRKSEALLAEGARRDRAEAGSSLAAFLEDDGADQVTDQVTDQVGRLLSALGDKEMSALELMSSLGLKHRPTFRRNYLAPALESGLVERTIPDRPNSSKQRYRRAR